MHLQSTQGIGLSTGVKMLVYGPSGIGKTKLIATAPAPVIFSAEGGLLSLSGYNLPFIEIHNIQDLYECWRWVTSSHESRQFHTICLDSLSEIAEVILADSKTNVKDARQAYLEVLDRMMVLVRQFRDLQGRHVYFTAKQETNDLGQITPSMPGRKLGPSLPYHFDLVFHMELESNAPQPYRFLRTQPDMFSVAKDRSGRLQPIERPDISYIIRTILGT